MRNQGSKVSKFVAFFRSYFMHTDEADRQKVMNGEYAELLKQRKENEGVNEGMDENLVRLNNKKKEMKKRRVETYEEDHMDNVGYDKRFDRLDDDVLNHQDEAPEYVRKASSSVIRLKDDFVNLESMGDSEFSKRVAQWSSGKKDEQNLAHEGIVDQDMGYTGDVKGKILEEGSTQEKQSDDIFVYLDGGRPPKDNEYYGFFVSAVGNQKEYEDSFNDPSIIKIYSVINKSKEGALKALKDEGYIPLEVFDFEFFKKKVEDIELGARSVGVKIIRKMD